MSMRCPACERQLKPHLCICLQLQPQLSASCESLAHVATFNREGVPNAANYLKFFVFSHSCYQWQLHVLPWQTVNLITDTVLQLQSFDSVLSSCLFSGGLRWSPRWQCLVRSHQSLQLPLYQKQCTGSKNISKGNRALNMSLKDWGLAASQPAVTGQEPCPASYLFNLFISYPATNPLYLPHCFGLCCFNP